MDYAGGLSHVWRLNPILAIHFFSLCALLVVYPIALVRALETHRFWPSMQLHLELVAVFGLYYRFRVRKFAKEERVGALSFIPLALFTLDSGSWETRDHGVEPVPEPVLGEATGQVALVAEPVRARAPTGQISMPAA